MTIPNFTFDDLRHELNRHEELEQGVRTTLARYKATLEGIIGAAEEALEDISNTTWGYDQVNAAAAALYAELERHGASRELGPDLGDTISDIANALEEMELVE